MRYLVAVLSIIIFLGIYFQLRQQNQIDEEAWHQIEINRSETVAEKEKRQYLITIMFQQAGITLILFFIPMIFLIYQNQRIREKIYKKITAFNSLSLVMSPKPDENRKTFYQLLLKQHPGLTANDLELCSLLKENIGSKEIASRFNITPASVYTARYRLRKRLGLDDEEDLVVYLAKFGH